MSDFSRREFIAATAATGVVAMNSGLLSAAETAVEKAPASKGDMVIVRWKGDKDVKDLTDDEVTAAGEKMVIKAMEALGGMSRFVKKDMTVWVKPNIGWARKPEYAANTNPAVVGAIVKMCFEAGAKAVKVGDNPCNPVNSAYEMSGIGPAVRKAGGTMVILDKDRFRKYKIDGEKLKEIPIYPEILEADLVINVPVVKQHEMATATMCMKNYMGVVEKRQLFHQDFAATLCDITRYMKPQFCILDAVRIMTAKGPQGGDLKHVKRTMTLAAGTDIVALDALGAELLGRKPDEIKYIAHADKLGLGKMDYRSLTPKELTVS